MIKLNLSIREKLFRSLHKGVKSSSVSMSILGYTTESKYSSEHSCMSGCIYMLGRISMLEHSFMSNRIYRLRRISRSGCIYWLGRTAKRTLKHITDDITGCTAACLLLILLISFTPWSATAQSFIDRPFPQPVSRSEEHTSELQSRG